jgi:hypothetical protein
MMKLATKIKSQKAFAIARDNVICYDAIEPWTDEGRRVLLRQINRAARERVVTIRITHLDKRMTGRG